MANELKPCPFCGEQKDRVISVEKTVRELQNEIYWNDSTKVAIRAFLRTVPAVDAVEVVRCKDCKHSYDGVANLMCGRCGQHINGIRLGGVSVKEEHFCSYGERKTDEEH